MQELLNKTQWTFRHMNVTNLRYTMTLLLTLTWITDFLSLWINTELLKKGMSFFLTIITSECDSFCVVQDNTEIFNIYNIRK